MNKVVHLGLSGTLTGQGGVDGVLPELVLLRVGGALDEVADQVEHHAAHQGVPRVGHSVKDQVGVNQTAAGSHTHQRLGGELVSAVTAPESILTQSIQHSEDD